MTTTNSGHARKVRRGLIALVLVSVCLPLAYCALVPPPAEIAYPYPQASDNAQALLDEFWPIFQRQDVAALADTRCGAEVAHALADVDSTPQELAEMRRNAPPPELAADARSDPNRPSDLICRFERLVKAQPTDQTATVVLSAMYMWRVQSQIQPAMIELDLREARHHAAQSVANGNTLAGGFEASPAWILGALKGNRDDEQTAYERLVRDTLGFPTFHGYIEGAVLSGMLNPEQPDPAFDYNWAAVSFMENIETCLIGNKLRGFVQLPEGMQMNNFFLNTTAFVSKITHRGYCYNTDVAPFNIQGLFVTQGDAYLKEGKLEYAKVAYENALRSPNTENWGYADQVELRLAQMERLQSKFLEDSGKVRAPQEPTAMIFQATWYCAACHQHPTNFRER